MLNFSFVTPRKAHPCAEPHLLTYPLPDLDIFCRVVGDDQLRGGRGGQILPSFVGFRRRPYNTLALLPCKCVKPKLLSCTTFRSGGFKDETRMC